MWYIIVCNVIAFSFAALVFPLLARNRPVLAWGLAICTNIPALFFLAVLGSSNADWAQALIVTLLVFFGFGGLGMGAFVGLAIASVFGDSIAGCLRSILQKIKEARG
ncbi:hypothetical protein HZZ13_35240 [Bradyrhizobium sp. CNPSo 4010]|uniref:Uncharacterized protein n=1 Tax=Bradyrhizobium agreste TaxID=2751811 RepID=A0ABS0Q0N7_9BRAD|nr:hypothetical protein [Bradyrhizobium agreste]MBH5403013.1 hypothetical protein [Bradyrhizobium agreste]